MRYSYTVSTSHHLMCHHSFFLTLTVVCDAQASAHIAVTETRRELTRVLHEELRPAESELCWRREVCASHSTVLARLDDTRRAVIDALQAADPACFEKGDKDVFIARARGEGEEANDAATTFFSTTTTDAAGAREVSAAVASAAAASVTLSAVTDLVVLLLDRCAAAATTTGRERAETAARSLTTSTAVRDAIEATARCEAAEREAAGTMITRANATRHRPSRVSCSTVVVVAGVGVGFFFHTQNVDPLLFCRDARTLHLVCSLTSASTLIARSVAGESSRGAHRHGERDGAKRRGGARGGGCTSVRIHLAR